MLGHSHAVSGLAVATAVYRPLTEFAGVHANPGQYVLCAVLTAGAAIAPDLDVHGSSAARAFGGPTRLLGWVVAAVGCGHRYGTHCIPGIAVVTVAAAVATVFGGWPVWIAVWLLLGFAIKALRVGRWIDDVKDSLGAAACSAGVVWVLAVSHVDLRALPFLVGVGLLTHSVGDCITNEGMPWWFPFSRRRYCVGPRRENCRPGEDKPRRRGLFKAGAPVEKRRIVPALWVAVVLITVTQAGWWAPIIGYAAGLTHHSTGIVLLPTTRS